MSDYIEIKDYCDKKGKRIKLIYNPKEVHKIKDGNKKDIQYVKKRCVFANECNEVICPHNFN